MAKLLLTDPFLRNLPVGPLHWDAHTTGLVARRQTKGGTVTWIFAYKEPGPRKPKTKTKVAGEDAVAGEGDAADQRKGTVESKRRKTVIGHYPGLTLAKAREIAGGMRKALQAGRLPHATTDAPQTVNDLIAEYEAHLISKGARSAVPTITYLKKHVGPVMGLQRLDRLERQDVQALIRKTGNAEVGKFFRAMWRLGLKRGYVERDIVGHLDLPKKGNGPRQRVLADPEIKALMADWLPDRTTPRSAFCAVFALGLLTGARRTELAELQWGEIDWAASVLRIPAERIKQKRPSTIVLSAYALAILQKVPRDHPTLVFPSPYKVRVRPGARAGRAGRGAISGWTPAHKASMKRTDVIGWTPHDTRRTFATGLVRMGAPPHVADAALNHSPPVLVQTYQVFAHEAEIRRFAEKWSAHVAGLRKTMRVQGTESVAT